MKYVRVGDSVDVASATIPKLDAASATVSKPRQDSVHDLHKAEATPSDPETDKYKLRPCERKAQG